MDYRELVEYQWPYLLSFLEAKEPLDDSAKRYGAMTRRRQIDSADKLLQLLFAYSFCGLSLRQTAGWAESAGIASVSDVALLKRFKNSADWLGYLVGSKLAARSSSRLGCPLQLVLVDATTVNAPGNVGTDWRLHLGFDLAAFRVSDVSLTDFRGGETFKRFDVSPGDVMVGDRGYCRRSDLASVIQRRGDFIVRLNWATLPLAQEDGKQFDLVEALRAIPEAEVAEFHLTVKQDARNRVLPPLPVRVVAVRKSEAAADHERKRLLTLASKKQRKIDPRTLEMAAYVVIVTSLSSDRISAPDLLEIYRFRWQIELLFKRLKSLLDLNGLPAKDPRLARTFIYVKVLAALLVDDLTQAFVSFSPWGYKLR